MRQQLMLQGDGMMRPGQSIFRESAMQEYMHRQEQDTLPHLITPFFLTFFYALLILLLLGGLLLLWNIIPMLLPGR